MFMKFWIFEIALLYAVNGFVGPVLADEAAINRITTCEEFEQEVELDPKDIVTSLWKIIYFWSGTTEKNPIVFSLLDSKRLEKFRRVVDTIVPEYRIEWHKAIFMMEPRPGVQVVFIYAGTPGAFRGVIKMEQGIKERSFMQPQIKMADIRMKQKGKYLGMMCCEDLTAFVMARIDNLPATEDECKEAAATLGLNEPNGRSYFYLQNITRKEL